LDRVRCDLCHDLPLRLRAPPLAPGGSEGGGAPYLHSEPKTLLFGGVGARSLRGRLGLGPAVGGAVRADVVAAARSRLVAARGARVAVAAATPAVVAARAAVAVVTARARRSLLAVA